MNKKYSLDPKDWIPADKYQGTAEEMKALQDMAEKGVDLSKFYIMPEVK